MEKPNTHGVPPVIFFRVSELDSKSTKPTSDVDFIHAPFPGCRLVKSPRNTWEKDDDSNRVSGQVENITAAGSRFPALSALFLRVLDGDVFNREHEPVDFSFQGFREPCGFLRPFQSTAMLPRDFDDR